MNEWTIKVGRIWRRKGGIKYENRIRALEDAQDIWNGLVSRLIFCPNIRVCSLVIQR